MNINMHEFYFCDTSAVVTSTITAIRDIDELKRKRLLRRVGNKIDKATKRQLKVNMYSHSIHLKDTTSEDGDGADGDGDDTNTNMQCFATTMDMQTARAIAGLGSTTQQNICSKAVHQCFLQPILPFVKISKDLSDLVLLRNANGNGNGAGGDLDLVELLLLFNNGYESLTQKANANAADSDGNEGEIMKEWVQTKLNRAVWKWNNKKKLGWRRNRFQKAFPSYDFSAASSNSNLKILIDEPTVQTYDLEDGEVRGGAIDFSMKVTLNRKGFFGSTENPYSMSVAAFIVAIVNIPNIVVALYHWDGLMD